MNKYFCILGGSLKFLGDHLPLLNEVSDWHSSHGSISGSHGVHVIPIIKHIGNKVMQFLFFGTFSINALYIVLFDQNKLLKFTNICSNYRKYEIAWGHYRKIIELRQNMCRINFKAID